MFQLDFLQETSVFLDWLPLWWRLIIWIQLGHKSLHFAVLVAHFLSDLLELSVLIVHDLAHALHFDVLIYCNLSYFVEEISGVAYLSLDNPRGHFDFVLNNILQSVFLIFAYSEASKA